MYLSLYGVLWSLGIQYKQTSVVYSNIVMSLCVLDQFNMIRFSCRFTVTRLGKQMKQELPTLPEHMCSAHFSPDKDDICVVDSNLFQNWNYTWLPFR